MNLLELMVKVGVDDQVTGKLGGIADGAKGIAGGVAKAGAAIAGATAAAGAAVGAMGEQALDSYAKYEQLAGGIDKLYGNAGKSRDEYIAESSKSYEEANAEWLANEAAFSAVMENAQQAYMTAGLSANDYMEQAMGMSAALVNSLGGDTVKAAELTDVAMRAMSDNINTFGTDAEMVQNAFQGFARGNYTMLDNLRLGYGQSKEEMQRLIADAAACSDAQEKLGMTVDATSLSFDNIVKAIQVVQYEQGIAGTTAREAATTIEGSINMTKAAWQNLLAEFGKEDGDVGARLGELVESAKTALLGHLDEATGEVKGGILPRVREIVASIADVLPEVVPQMLEMGKELFGAIGEAIAEVAPTLLEAVTQALSELAAFVGENSDQMAEGAIQFFLAIIDALAEIAPAVMEALTSLTISLVGALIEHIPDFLDAALQLVLGLVEGFANGLVPMMGAAEEVVNGALEAIGAFFGGMLDAGVQLIENVANGVSDAARGVWDAATGAVQDAVDGVGDFVKNMFNAGLDLIGGLIDGLLNNPTIVIDTLMGMAQGAVDGFLNFFGIASPSKRMRGYGRNIMEGLALGIADKAADAESAMLSAMSAIGDVQAGVRFPQLAFEAGAALPFAASSGDVYNIFVTTREGEDVAVRIRNELHAYNMMRGR